MPSLPKPRLRRSARARADGTSVQTAAEPNVEVVTREGVGAEGGPAERGDLRWVNIERPSSVDRAWLEEHFEFHPLDYEDVASRNQRPKIDE
ncbi:MAG TPA: CorA family divalent cation transporter, partial [Thermoleophilaceae bacterium]|nr:CorA family divalent cation transporter [Thermoleophilaceae bacterium]